MMAVQIYPACKLTNMQYVDLWFSSALAQKRN